MPLVRPVRALLALLLATAATVLCAGAAVARSSASRARTGLTSGILAISPDVGNGVGPHPRVTAFT